MRDTRGITLVALVITIVVLLILAGITIYLTVGNNGILEKTMIAKEETTIQSLKEKIEIAIMDIQIEEVNKSKEEIKQKLIEKLPNKLPGLEIIDDTILVEYDGYQFEIDYNFNVYYVGKKSSEKLMLEYSIQNEWTDEITIIVTAKVENGGEVERLILPDGSNAQNNSVSYLVRTNGTYRFTAVGKTGKRVSKDITIETIYRSEEKTIVCDDIIKVVKDEELESGNYIFKVQEESYSVELYNYYHDIIYTVNTELGNEESDAKMVIAKHHKNVTVENGVTITTKVRKKGMYFFVNGELTNKGEITMTQRGAIAEGQKVYLYKNQDGSYEYVPVEGATGGSAVRANGGSVVGKVGDTGQNRATGGGGSGGARGTPATSGAGSAGTSYSGGTGGGASHGNGAVATAGSANGGSGRKWKCI